MEIEEDRRERKETRSTKAVGCVLINIKISLIALKVQFVESFTL